MLKVANSVINASRITGVLPVVNGGTGVTTSTGTGNTVLSAAPTLSGDVTLSTGNMVPSTAAKGINFTANTPAAGMTSQLLNWYEEGAWTPIATPVAGAFTTVSASGRYIRVGKLVTVTINAYIVNVGTSTGLAGFSGLPFTSENQNPQGSGLLRNSLDATSWSVVVSKNATTCITNKYLGTTVVVNNDQFIGSFSYFAA